MSDEIELIINTGDVVELTIQGGDTIEIAFPESVGNINNQFPYYLPFNLI